MIMKQIGINMPMRLIRKTSTEKEVELDLDGKLVSNVLTVTDARKPDRDVDKGR